jgi:uncharacterized protein
VHQNPTTPARRSSGGRRARRTALGAAATLATLTGSVLLAGPASAHVSVNPPEATAGGFTKLTFQVPTEAPKASTTKVSVSFPSATPLASVSVKPHPGWTAEVTKAKLADPVVDDDGLKITEAVSRITWVAQKGTSIAPGQFDEFDVSVGPLPSTGKSMSFPVVQSYDDGTTVRWTDPVSAGGKEPEHPAPTLTLAADPPAAQGASADPAPAPATVTVTPSAAASGAPAAQSTATDGTARALGAAGLVVGVLGLIAGATGFGAARRRSA